METALYLIPVLLGDTEPRQVLPDYNRDVILNIRHFVVEDVRSARRFLKRVEKSIDIDALSFYPMGKHADRNLYAQYLEPLRKGESVGVLSRSGGRGSTRGSAGRVACDSVGWSVVYTTGCNGVRIQRTEFCLQRLSSY